MENNKKLKLTSVNILKENYDIFKKTTLITDITFQKLVNRALDLYNKEKEFRKKINNHKTDGQENSKY